MTLFHQRQGLSLLTRAVHVWLLLGWLLSAHGLAPAFALTTAWAHGGHGVKVGASLEGAVTVVLTHDGGSLPSEEHEHEALGVFIAVFGGTVDTDRPDHILSFQSVDDVSRILLRFSALGEMIDLSVPLAGTLFKQPFMARRTHVVCRHEAPAWSPGLAMKAGKTLMRC